MSGDVVEIPLAEQKTRLTRRSFMQGAALGTAGLALYSGEVARHEIGIVTQEIAIRNLPNAFQKYRIAQISDIHFDEYTEPSFVRRVVGQVNSLAPDLVLMTGDYISNKPLGHDFAYGAVFRCAEVLRELTCPLRFAVMGNHDTILGPPNIREALATASIPLLVNEYVPIQRSGERLWLAGVADPVCSVPNLDLAVPASPDGPVLLLCHAPDFADTVLAHRRGPLVNLMLSGHTHGGQIRLPLLGPLILPSGGQKYVEGYFRFGAMQLYVNRGIGTVGLPLRLNCPPEITLFTLRRQL